MILSVDSSSRKKIRNKKYESGKKKEFTTATMKSKNLRTKKKKLKSGKYI